MKKTKWKKVVFVLCLKFEEVYVGFYKGWEQKGWYVTTLTWSTAKNKVMGQLAMTHALASHSLITLNFNYYEISQFTLDFYHEVVLEAEDFS